MANIQLSPDSLLNKSQWSLYNIDKEIESIINQCTDFGTGEISEEAIERLEDLNQDKILKIESLAHLYKNLVAFSEMVGNERAKLAAKEKAYTAKADKVKRIITNFLQGDKLETPTINISYRKSESVEVNEADMLILNSYEELLKSYPDLIQVKTAYQVDKYAIKSRVKNGFPIPEGIAIKESIHTIIK